jgi:SAM-dependent methyltransferase
MKEWIRVRRYTWACLINLLKEDITFDNSKRILEIGGGPTSIFLALREGQRYMVDLNCEFLFQLHPFIKELEEYKDVNFIASPIEEAAFDKKFDLIFTINMLDHVGEFEPVLGKIDELLKGTLVIIVDCYADVVVRNIIRFFDVDIPHPHHFVVSDIIKLFSSYQLVRQENNLSSIFDTCTFRGQKSKIEIFRIDRLASRMIQNLSSSQKKGTYLFVFSLKYVFCYSLALLVSFLKRCEKPIHPLKKPRLFIFKKP